MQAAKKYLKRTFSKQLRKHLGTDAEDAFYAIFGGIKKTKRTGYIDLAELEKRFDFEEPTVIEQISDKADAFVKDMGRNATKAGINYVYKALSTMTGISVDTLKGRKEIVSNAETRKAKKREMAYRDIEKDPNFIKMQNAYLEAKHLGDKPEEERLEKALLGYMSAVSGIDLTHKEKGLAGTGYELHMPGHQFTGPGTKISKRIVNKVQPADEVDAISKTHDIDYSTATTPDAVRRADRKMENSLLAIRNTSKNKTKLYTALAGIRSKIIMEDLGVIPKMAFVNAKKLDDKEIQKYKKNFDEILKELDLELTKDLDASKKEEIIPVTKEIPAPPSGSSGEGIISNLTGESGELVLKPTLYKSNKSNNMSAITSTKVIDSSVAANLGGQAPRPSRGERKEEKEGKTSDDQKSEVITHTAVNNNAANMNGEETLHGIQNLRPYLNVATGEAVLLSAPVDQAALNAFNDFTFIPEDVDNTLHQANVFNQMGRYGGALFNPCMAEEPSIQEASQASEKLKSKYKSYMSPMIQTRQAFRNAHLGEIGGGRRVAFSSNLNHSTPQMRTLANDSRLYFPDRVIGQSGMGRYRV